MQDILLDPEFEYLREFAYPHSKGYVMVSMKSGSYDLLHRIIMQPPKNYTVDHINGDRKDNRKVNLRVCSYANNNINTPKRKLKGTAKSRSKYKGVVYDHRKSKPWRSHVKWMGMNFELGHFSTEEEAALAYNDRAKMLHGEFANLNVIEVLIPVPFS